MFFMLNSTILYLFCNNTKNNDIKNFMLLLMLFAGFTLCLFFFHWYLTYTILTVSVVNAYYQRYADLYRFILVVGFSAFCLILLVNVAYLYLRNIQYR